MSNTVENGQDAQGHNMCVVSTALMESIGPHAQECVFQTGGTKANEASPWTLSYKQQVNPQ